MPTVTGAADIRQVVTRDTGAAALPSSEAAAAGRHGQSGGGRQGPSPPPTNSVPWLVVTVQNAARKSGASDELAELLGLRFPSRADVERAATVLQVSSRTNKPRVQVSQYRHGLTAQIEVSPGSIRFRRTAPSDADPEAGSQKGAGRHPIVGWTLKSRRQMTRSYAAIDYAPMFAGGRVPAMVTLTYPADWLTVAPTRQAVQHHFGALERRFVRAWDEPLIALWKLEYQERGAPHYHLLMRKPHGVAGHGRKVRYQAAMAAWEASGRAGPRPRWRSRPGDGLQFGKWLAVVWADIVGHPDPVERMKHEAAGVRVDVKRALDCRDPRRASIYFSKHGVVKGSKEYQNRPPREWLDAGIGPGRYWGYVGLKQLVVAVQLDGGRDYQLAKRIMRRWSARTRVWDDASCCYRYVKAMQVKAKPTVGRPGRRVRRPVNRLAGASGSLCLNDAPAMAVHLARAIERARDG